MSTGNTIVIIDDPSYSGRLIAIVEIINSSDKTVAAIEIDGTGRMNGSQIDSNAIVTVFEKKNMYGKYLKDALNSELSGNGGIYYWQKNKAIQNLRTSGVQFPVSLSIRDGFIRSISDPLSKVNRKNIKGYDIVLSNNNISHIFKNHGAEQSENARGQIAITKDNFKDVIDAVLSPDDVELVSDKNGEALKFTKNTDNKTIAITVTSTKKALLH